MDLIDRHALLATLEATRDEAAAGEARNPDDDEWTTIRECAEDAIRAVNDAPAVITLNLQAIRGHHG